MTLVDEIVAQLRRGECNGSQLAKEGGALLVHGASATPREYARAMQRDLLMFGRCFERVSIDGSRELISPDLFLRTCSKCGRGFFEDTSEPALEAVARKRCSACR